MFCRLLPHGLPRPKMNVKVRRPLMQRQRPLMHKLWGWRTKVHLVKCRCSSCPDEYQLQDHRTACATSIAAAEAAQNEDQRKGWWSADADWTTVGGATQTELQCKHQWTAKAKSTAAHKSSPTEHQRKLRRKRWYCLNYNFISSGQRSVETHIKTVLNTLKLTLKTFFDALPRISKCFSEPCISH